MKTNMINLIAKDLATDLRAWSNNPTSCGQEIGTAMTCDREKFIQASGRATCRECGKRIEPMTEAIPFYVSFTDGSYNSWTATKAYIHRHPQECGNVETTP
jgi:hypothetical protein